MIDHRLPDNVVRVLRLLAERLEALAEGDELAFDGLGSELEETLSSTPDLELAALLLRGVAGGSAVEPALDPPAGSTHRILRVWSREERESLSPEAFGFLLALEHRGELSPGQFERVMDRLAAAEERPVPLEVAREAASQVVLEPRTGTVDGAFDTTH
jgi:uncharacterized protein Smg (DUF494 family)